MTDDAEFEAAGIPDTMMDHPMWDPLVDLVALAATYDQRKAGPLDVKAWFLVASVEAWDVAAVQRVIVEWYARTKERLAPSDVSQRLRAVRRAADETFEDPRVPDDLHGQDYPSWYRTQQDQHIRRCIAAWAATGVEPQRQAIEARSGGLVDLVARAPEHVRGEITTAAERIAGRRP
jgi:hypothetical protein